MPTISAAGAAATLVARAAVSGPSHAQGPPQLRVRAEKVPAGSSRRWLTPWGAGRRRRAADLTDLFAPAAPRRRRRRHLSVAYASTDSSGSGAAAAEASAAGVTSGREEGSGGEGGASAEFSAGEEEQPPPVDPRIEKELRKAVQKTAATFAPRASTKTKNPAVPGTALYTVFEVQGYISMVLGGALSFNLVFPSNEPDIWRLMGMWSIWMFSKSLFLQYNNQAPSTSAAIPSLRARDCSSKEKEALNYLFLLIPLINVIIPFFVKSFAVVWSADTVAFFMIWDGCKGRNNHFCCDFLVIYRLEYRYSISTSLSLSGPIWRNMIIVPEMMGINAAYLEFAMGKRSVRLKLSLR
ncbi:hypothetical protein U9M48_044517 [Paspalum notatum var. saurae]|uniref:Uncharacterized protein n=1 Tax=Paspalum notatum var. saurae TaxID=547442 RepID=A0AAQ3UX28_PASNO